MTDIEYLVLSVALTWVMLLAASLLRARAWTGPGMLIAFGNRDDLPEPIALAGRADRAARNMLENLVLFTAAFVAARLAGANEQEISAGAALFFWARLAYFPIYLAGIRYLRTAIWALGVVAIARIAFAAWAV